MASKASSEVSPSQSGDGPPAQIPALKGLGTSWYERGTRYWLRRVFTAVVFLAVMALCCFMALAFYDGFRSVLPLAVRIVWDWAQVAASCLAVVWGWLVQRRAHHRQLLEPPTPAEFSRAKRDEARRTTGLALLGRGLLLFAAPVLPALAAFGVGWTVAMLTVRVYPSEVGARRWLEKHPSGT